MPKAKRSKVVSLTKTDRKTRADKESHMEKVREAAQQYGYVWLLCVAVLDPCFVCLTYARLTNLLFLQ